MKTLRANIPSKRDFTVNEKGEVFSPFGKKLLGSGNPASTTLRSLNFMRTDGKRQTISFSKLMWNTFFPNDPIKSQEIIILIDNKLEFPFAVSNLRKVSRKETVDKLNKIRLELYAKKREEKSK